MIVAKMEFWALNRLRLSKSTHPRTKSGLDEGDETRQMKDATTKTWGTAKRPSTRKLNLRVECIEVI